MRSQPRFTPSRRDFIKTSAATTAALFATHSFAHARGSDALKVGLIGCGGRGTGAAQDCVSSSAGVEIHALGDLFADRLEECRKNLAPLGDKLKLAPERCLWIVTGPFPVRYA